MYILSSCDRTSSWLTHSHDIGMVPISQVTFPLASLTKRQAPTRTYLAAKKGTVEKVKSLVRKFPSRRNQSMKS